jgi:hypothetical protein
MSIKHIGLLAVTSLISFSTSLGLLPLSPLSKNVLAQSQSRVGCPECSNWSPLQLGRRWIESEAGWTGQWRRRGNSTTFDAIWTKPGERQVTAVMTMYVEGRSVYIERRNSSDGNNCNYSGTLINNSASVVEGQYSCNRGGGSWRADIKLR